MPLDISPSYSDQTLPRQKTVSEKTQPYLQKTLRSGISCRGVGLHSGAYTNLTINPAPAGHGIVFMRSDVTDRDNRIAALWNNVSDTKLCTVIQNEAGVSVATIEHLMAALHGMGIDNVLIELDGPEVPIMDGSAEPYVFLIECAGIETQSAPRTVIEILRPVSVSNGDMKASLRPSYQSSYEVEIEFSSPIVRSQRYSIALTAALFRRDLARARTFGFLSDVDKLRQMGLAKGGSLDNAIVIDSDRVLNEGGLRYGDEFARHKVLDAIGDLALAGAHIQGHFSGIKSGHALNNQLLRAVFADPANYRIVTTSAKKNSQSSKALLAA